MGGWIKIHRDIAKHWIFQDAEKFKWWIDMLFLASFEDNKVLVGNRIAEVKRGQFLGSLAFLAKRWGVSKDRVVTFLKLLQSEGMIRKETLHNIPYLTICNYESYQDTPDTLPDRQPVNLPYTLPTPSRQTKEIQEIQEIYNTPTAHTCACEDDFIRRYREEGMWTDVAMILHRNIADCESLFDRWVVEYQHNGDTHSSYSDFKKHFIQWARITIQKESINGNYRPDNSRRGRAPVPDDISLDF